MSFEIPQAEEVDDLLLSCRYGDLEDVREFVAKFGVNELVKARDEALQVAACVSPGAAWWKLRIDQLNGTA